ncbi:amidohydrolase 2 [Mollisia scopiformis]|uniref:Amidohydrolase 2 n=1 Tax=Mollisia scopiformis TaxID=149040 RepID=A0A194XF94_MOLSC|nr:amidohydrolase 2 [Mollisia scopiformis]KUJ18437.1 amidohydrolase 2 [Mollisia scopiformis]
MAEENVEFPVIDSHIHLFPESELETLAWCSPSNPLHKQHSLDEYEAATGCPPSFEGFIFLETDRKHDLKLGAEDGRGWEMPLMEVEWLKRVALGTPRDGEGHSEGQKKLCLAIIPWAPLPSGADVLQRYVKEVEKHAESSFSKIKGFRYLVQDKPRGVMLQHGFIEGLKWLGKNGYVFDLGVDQHSGGKWQLEEAVEMIEKAHEDVPEEEKVTFIINHLCKPDLSVYNQTDPKFVAWRTAMFKLSKCSKTFLKLSGCFSEMPDALKKAPVDEIFLALQPYLVVILATFGPFRIMFGSDWPVCTIGVDDAWKKWRQVVERFCDLASLSQAEQIMIWSGTAIKAYGIEELM